MVASRCDDLGKPRPSVIRFHLQAMLASVIDLGLSQDL